MYVSYLSKLKIAHRNTLQRQFKVTLASQWGRQKSARSVRYMQVRCMQVRSMYVRSVRSICMFYAYSLYAVPYIPQRCGKRDNFCSIFSVYCLLYMIALCSLCICYTCSRFIIITKRDYNGKSYLLKVVALVNELIIFGRN